MTLKASVILVHLGEAVPLYMKYCIHQLRLWNTPEELEILLVLDSVHRGSSAALWSELESTEILFTDTLEPTPEHTAFRENYKGDTAFRKGYWRNVKERFFFMEEVMRSRGIERCFAMEYDILVYGNLLWLREKMKDYSKSIAMVMDNDIKGHPGFLYLPSADAIQAFNQFIVQMIRFNYDDMQLLALFKTAGGPFAAKTLPVISPDVNAKIPERKSLEGHTCADTSFLSDGFTELGVLFDSLCMGQYLGGIDPRNVGILNCPGYINEGAFYSVNEMEIGWKREYGLWSPVLGGHPLVTIHIHSKGLQGFISDRETMPSNDYDVAALLSTLQPNYCNAQDEPVDNTAQS